MPALRASNQSPRRSGQPKRHPEFYMPHGDFVVRVENTLFRVHLAILQGKSPIFCINVPAASAQLHSGDAHPFVLLEDSAEDFERLLWMLYPSKSPIPRATRVEEWVSVLRLSYKYNIEDVFERAANNLSSMQLSDPLKVIVVWEKFRLNSMQLLPAYSQLCRRKRSFSLDETMAIGIVNFTRLAAARDLYNQSLSAAVKPADEKGLEELAEKCVKKVFTQKGHLRKSDDWSRLGRTSNL